ncbi:MAG: four helix bundle protein [Candidatus Vogelbacteria bacterium]|nr:four helix bundle protein [Candidatus Vogelbacteria bacterium]
MERPPRRKNLPIIERLVTAYKLWHGFQVHIPKVPRYSLGIKIDRLFIEVIELVFNTLQTNEKMSPLESASQKMDTLKFMLRVAWETGVLDDKKYTSLSEELNEVGRQLGGWLKKVQKENSAR